VIAVSRVLPSLLSNNRLLAYDFMNHGKLSSPYSPECNPPAYLERTGLDLDETGAPLSLYKVIKAIYPLVVTYDNIDTTIQLGSSMTPSGPVSWDPPIVFDPTSAYKIDSKRGGRYLAFRVTVTEPADFEVSGFDADIANGGLR
jgi:hypothetical protein